MKNFLLTALFLTGCSETFIERVSTEPYRNHSNEAVSLTEMYVGTKTYFGEERRLYIHNPYSYPVMVSLACRSMFQADPIVHVQAESSRYVMITAPAKSGDSCFIQNVVPSEE